MDDSHFAFLLVVNVDYWKRLTQKNSQIKYFVRGGTAAPTQTNRLLFYVTKKTLVLGTADFVERVVGSPIDLWEKYGTETPFDSVKEYKKLCGGNSKMTFIHFENFKEIENPKTKNEVIDALESIVWIKPRYISRKKADLLTGFL